MTDKLITHEEARDMVTNNIIEWFRNELLAYITQQEQFAKDVARYLWLLTYEYGEDYQVGKISNDEYNRLKLEEETLKEKLTKGVAK